MNISGLSNTFLQRINNASTDTAEPQPAPSKPQNKSVDTVTISPQAQALAAETPEELKKLGMPGWLSDYTPKINILNNADSAKLGYSAWAENYRAVHRNELQEYGEIFNSHYEATKTELGINSQDDMYENVIKNPAFSETLRQAVEKKMTDDPRATALMNTLGIGHA